MVTLKLNKPELKALIRALDFSIPQNTNNKEMWKRQVRILRRLEKLREPEK